MEPVATGHPSPGCKGREFVKEGVSRRARIDIDADDFAHLTLENPQTEPYGNRIIRVCTLAAAEIEDDVFQRRAG